MSDKGKIKNIVFDMGNVLLYFDPPYFIEKLGVTDPSEKEMLITAIFHAPEWVELDWGRLTEEQALKIMQSRLPEHLHEIARLLVMMWDRPILEVPGMYELIRDLKMSGYGIYLLSNASLRQHDYWPRIPASKYFDGTVVSADYGTIKPYPEIYKILFEKFSLEPSECVFIDDRMENVKGGIDCGMPGILFENDVEKIKEELAQLGVGISG